MTQLNFGKNDWFEMTHDADTFGIENRLEVRTECAVAIRAHRAGQEQVVTEGKTLFEEGAERAGLRGRLVGADVPAPTDRGCAGREVNPARTIAIEQTANELDADRRGRSDIVVDLVCRAAADVGSVGEEVGTVVDLEAEPAVAAEVRALCRSGRAACPCG